MDLAAADRHHIVERLFEQCLPFALAPGHRRKPKFAVAALRGIEAELREAVAMDLRLHRGRRVVVGKLQLHRLEAGSGGSTEALEQRALGEEVSEIGGDAGHLTSGVLTNGC